MPPRSATLAASLAGLVDPDTGRLRSSVPLDALIYAKRVEIDRGVLWFDWKSGFDYVKPPANLLERFLVLKTDDAILSFARRFGPLGLSEPRLDRYLGLKSVGKRRDRREEAIADPQPVDGRRVTQYESVIGWRRYRSEFNALLALAAAFHEKESPNRELFETFQELGVVSAGEPGEHYPTLVSLMHAKRPPRVPSFIEEFESARVTDRLTMMASLLRGRINAYVRWCRLRPGLAWGSLEVWPPRMELAFQDATADSYSFGLSVFGALTVQLLAAATGSGFAVCSACGSVFVPRRRHPAFGKRRYCPACGPKAALKDAKTDYRIKLRKLGVRRLGALVSTETEEKQTSTRASGSRRQQDEKTLGRRSKGARRGKATR